MTSEMNSLGAPVDPYATHLNILFPHLAIVDVPAFVGAVKGQWFNHTPLPGEWVFNLGLVTRLKFSCTVIGRLQPQPMREAMESLRRYKRFRSGSLRRPTTYAERMEAEARRKRR
jgi:hypothetical protein